MNKLINIMIIICAFICLSGITLVKKPVLTPELQIKLEKNIAEIQSWINKPLFIDAVKAQNAKKMPLAYIKKLDNEWVSIIKNNKKENPLMKQLLNHPIGIWLRKKNKEERGRYPESFLCDNQGANVAISRLTSDYWQGDETKWIDSFNNGNGNVVIGDPKFDTSTGAMQIHVSIPVIDQGKTIGVFIIGIKWRHLKKD